MGQTSSTYNQPEQKVQKKSLSIFSKKNHNSYGQRRSQSLRTEEDEKNFYEEYSVVERKKDDYFGDCVIMREKNSNMKVCVKEINVQSHDQMRFIQQNLLTNYNCYNNEDEEQESHRNPNYQFSTLALPSNDQNLTNRRDENSFNNENNSQRKRFNIYHLNLISVVRVVKAKDDLDLFLCSQSFRVLYALEYSELNLNNYFINEHQALNETDIWQLLEQMTSALLYLQNQGKYHGDLSSRSIYIMPSSSCPHKNPGQLNEIQKVCDCQIGQNQFKWYKIAENELVRSLPLYEKIQQSLYYVNKKKMRGIEEIDHTEQMKGYYLSPELMQEMNTQKYKSTNDAHKADVFSLGCVILEVMGKSLRKYQMTVSLDGIFEYGLTSNSGNICQFNEMKLKNKIDTIAYSGVYNENLMNIISTMLTVDQFKRPDFKELSLMLQRLGKFNTQLNTQMIIKQSEALSSFNMTKSVQFNSLNSTQKMNPLTGFGNAESNEKVENVQSFLDCLQQMQQDQTKIQVERNDYDDNLFQYSQFNNQVLQSQKDKERITITPISEINYTQEMMNQDVAEEDYQLQRLSEKYGRNNARLIPSTQRESNKKLMLTPNSKILDYMNINVKNNRERQDENDSTIISNNNKSSRDISSLNTSIVSGPKASSRSILQENKSIMNMQEKQFGNERYLPNITYKEKTQFVNYHPQVDTYNKDVYAMIDANYKNNIMNYQHRRSNSTYVQTKNQDQNVSLHQELELVKRNSGTNYNSSTLNSSKQLSLKNESQKLQQPGIQRSASNSLISYQNENNELSSIIVKEADKVLFSSNSSNNLYSTNSQYFSSTSVQPQVKQQFKSYIPSYNSNNNDENQSLDNAIKSSNKIIMNQRQQLVQYMQNNFNKPESIINESEYKYDSYIPQNIPLPQDQGWKLQDSLPSHRSQSQQKIHTNSNNERMKSVQIENYDLSFRDGSEVQLSNRSCYTNRLPPSQQLLQIPSNTNQSYMSINHNQILSDNPNLPMKHDPITNESSSKAKKLQRNNSYKDETEILIQDQQYKINKPYSQPSQIILHSNNTSMNITPRTKEQNQSKSTTSPYTKQTSSSSLVPPLNIEQINDKQDYIKMCNNNNNNNNIYNQTGQNTESILDCSLLNDIKNTSITYNQQQLFTYSTGTLPSSTRNGCKRRTQSSFINDSSTYNQNNYFSNHLNNQFNNYLNSSINTSNAQHQNTSLQNQSNINSNYYTIQPIASQVSDIINNLQIQSNIPDQVEVTPFNNGLSQNKMQSQFQSNSHKPHKFELETVQELKESQFNQTTNLSANKQASQSALGQHTESINPLMTSYTPMRNSQNNTNIVNQQSAKHEKLSQSKMYENNLLLQQHSPPQKNMVVVKEFIQKQEDKDQKSTSNIQKEYVYEKYEDGAYYQGENWGTLRWGLGKFVYADGALYEGEWERGQMNGFGKLFYPSGNLAYEGKWKDDKFDGRGVIYNEKPLIINQGEEINYSDFNNMTEEWTKFDGEFKMDEKVGFGTFYFSNSSKFQCTFVDDMANGVGTFTFNDGMSQIVGEWRQNILVNTFRQK